MLRVRMGLAFRCTRLLRNRVMDVLINALVGWTITRRVLYLWRWRRRVDLLGLGPVIGISETVCRPLDGL